jgi:hypothetical protein
MIANRTSWKTRAAAIALLCFAASAQAASLDAQLLPAIQAATFEVVAAKPVDDPLQYEKPLPLDLLPYQERTDKYYSIGTAFSIGDGRYVTAAHVLMVGGAKSLWGPPALRDNAGRVYAIDKVTKFSQEKDFVVFTLAEQPAGAPLALDTSPKAGQAVYSVGNAYGTGVVIRDGLYTSDTPEPQDGRWKWMRFSAAASPGNSGGPLIDQDGKVIGVVLAKSPNENLNYALPVSMVQDAPEGVAEADLRMPYQFDAFDSTLSNTFKTRLSLPLPVADFYAAYEQRLNEYFDEQLKTLLAKEPQRTFPNGGGSSELLHGIASMDDFPMIVARNNNDTWVLAGNAGDNIKLSSNGYLAPGTFGNNLLFHLRKPDDVPADRLYTDASVPMDLLLKMGFIKRSVGSENITVTSLGKPSMDAMHVDAWGRRWQVREWPIPYANAVLTALMLPVPDGYVGIVRSSPPMQAHDYLINLKALADFTYVNYDGTLSQWKDYLRHAELQPTALKDTRIDFDYGKHFDYASKRLDFGFTPELQAIQPDSVLTLGFAFYRDHDKVVWDVGELWVSAKANDSNYAMVIRNQAPSPDLDDDRKNDWEKLVARKHPYDAVARNVDDTTKITAVADAPGTSDPAILYTAHYTAEGAQSQDAMKGKVDLMLKQLQVKEH